MAAVVTLIAHDGDTVDGLAWREARLGPQALIPLLDANLHLSERVTLNAGDRVIVPPILIENPAPAPVRRRVQLWD